MSYESFTLRFGRAQVEAFFDVHEELGTVPGGIHLEMTGVTPDQATAGERDLGALRLGLA